MLITTAIPSLLNGISQQPPAQRFPSQAEDQVNAYSSVVDGLSKRPNTEFIAEIGSSYSGNEDEYTHAINRDATERYMVVVSAADIKVFGVDGSAKTVNKPDGVGYLAAAGGASFDNSIRCVTVGDYTFILNRTKVVALDAALTASRNTEALVAVINGQYHAKYEIKIENSTYTHTAGGSSSDGDCITIAEALRAAYAAAPVTNISVERNGHVLRFYRADTTNFNISISDGFGGIGMSLVKDSVQSFQDLPTLAPHGMVVKIEGIPGALEDDHYVKFVAKNGAFGEGIWQESTKSGIKYKYDYTTMPHVLIRLSNGQFVFKKADGTSYNSNAGTDAVWAERYVGDDISNPPPSFVGQRINNIFLFKDRLGILANESIIMSETSEYFNFWRTTVTQLIDSDPIDIQSAFPQVSIMRAAIPINDRLIVFSDKAQFIMQGTQVLTPTSVSMVAATQYEMDPNIDPVSSGNSVFFAFKRSGNYGIREFIQSEQDANSFDAPEVTASVPRYLPAGIRRLIFNSIENLLVVLPTHPYSKDLFVYKFFGNGSQRIQSSWSKFTFAEYVYGVAFFDNFMYMTARNNTANTWNMEKMDLSPEQTDQAKNGVGGDNAEYKTLLDCRVAETACTVTYNSGTDLTTVTIPFDPITGGTMVIVSRKAYANSAYSNHGEVLYTGQPGSRTFTVPGKLETTEGVVAFYLGYKYEMLYEFSTTHLRVSRSQGSPDTITAGRLQVRYCSVQYADSGYFKTKVIPEYGSESVTEWTGNDMGLNNAALGKMTVSDGKYKFAVYGLNTEVRVQLLNDTFLPCSFLNAEFECLYQTRSRRT